MSSTRSELINLIETNLKTITKANGYNTDLGLEIFKYTRAVNQEDLPLVILEYDLQKREENQIVGFFNWQLIINIKIMINGIVNEQYIETYLSDIFNCFKTINNPAISRFDFTELKIEYEQGDTLLGVLKITFIIDYVTDKFNF